MIDVEEMVMPENQIMEVDRSVELKQSNAVSSNDGRIAKSVRSDLSQLTKVLQTAIEEGNFRLFQARKFSRE
jgi:hypothetical protein